MLKGSSWCVAGASALLGFASCAIPAELGPADAHALVEVRTLKGLPHDVVELLGSQGNGAPAIADAGSPFNRTDKVELHLPARRFIVAGSNLAKVLAAYEQGGHSYSIHASAFVLERSGWRQVGEWILSEKPYSVRDLVEMIFPDRVKLRAMRIGESQPRRRDGPLRANDITDEEVREIQSTTRQVVPGAIVSISGVVVGCACEDGRACSDQVWIVAYTPEVSRGLQLSKIAGHWMVGPVQQWWLNYDRIQASRQSFPSVNAFSEALSELNESFPPCERSTSQPETLAPGTASH